jgi:beta-glucanase (GH16 family)
MRKVYYLIFVILSWHITAQNNKVAANATCNVMNFVTSTTGICNTQPFVLAFEDNFDGNTLDLTKNWDIPYQGVWRDYLHQAEKQYYVNNSSDQLVNVLPMSNNIEVSNGTLKIWAKKQVPAISARYVVDYSTTPYTYDSASFDYSAAEVVSKKAFHYGIYEIRCKMPKGRGFFPAFWMFGGTSSYNELDVFEFVNESSSGNSYDPTLLAKNPKTNIYYSGTGTKYSCNNDNINGIDYSQAFHVFKVEWNEYFIIWYIDGFQVRIELYLEDRSIPGIPQAIDCNNLVSGSTYKLNRAFPRDPMTIRANFAIQAGGNLPDASTPFPSAYEIDYIRYYKQSDCIGRYDYTNVNQLITSTLYPNYYKGTRFTFSNNLVLPTGQALDFVTRDEIIISSDVIAPSGSDLRFRIDNSLCTDVLRIGEADPHTIEGVLLDTASYEILEQLSHISPYFDAAELKLDIKSALVNTYELSLVDYMGKTIFYKTNVVKKGENSFKINNLAKGIYIFKLQDLESGYHFTKKMIYVE